ncbi:MAG: head GIN domain-containing protein [Pseudomonadota bacterium]
MIDQVAKRIAPIALIAMSAGMAGCSYSIDIGSDGVPLSELDMSGEAPNKLSLAGPDRIIVTEGDTLDITVEGDTDNELRFEIDGDTLEISREDDSWRSSDTATVRVTMPAPQELSMAGSGVIESATLAGTGEIDIAGSGDVAVALVRADSLQVSIAGSGTAKAIGSADTLEVSIAGSGDVNFSELKAARVEVSIAGSGDVQVQSDGDVEASIAGSGDVEVTGNASCKLNSMGSGTLTCAPSSSDAAETEAAAETEDS